MTQLPLVPSNHDTFDTLQALSQETLEALLGKRPLGRAPWWIHKGKVAVVDAASTRDSLRASLSRLADLSLSSECHGAGLA